MEKTDKGISKVELAGTYLNICAIYSSLQRHLEAVKQAAKAIHLVKRYIDWQNHVKEGKGVSQSLAVD